MGLYKVHIREEDWHSKLCGTKKAVLSVRFKNLVYVKQQYVCKNCAETARKRGLL